MIPLSVLDLSPIVQGGTPALAFRHTLELAQHAERLGYTRFWLAEHHNMPGIGSAATAVLIGHVGAGTSRIRIGAGGIMLPNHAPLQVAEQFGWVKAHQEAHRLEHAISQDVEERLAKLLSNPTTCPHGNPIPGALAGPAQKTIPLNEASDGQSVELDFITEGGERDVRLLSFLQEHGMRPGAKVHVLDVAPSLGMMTLKVGADAFSLGLEAAKKIRVH